MFFATLILAAFSHASTIDLDKAAIKAMAGCYKVTFDFEETFKSDPNYPISSPKFHDYGLEYVSVDSESTTTVALQHILLTPGGIQKHWRQTWEYEPIRRLEFQANLTWTRQDLDPCATKGMWLQKVGQVDDSPRYECYASWDHSNGSAWSCAVHSPLPRREFSIRNDYNILARGNTHRITPYGWIHEQKNEKISKAADGAMRLIAREEGANTYEKVDPARCTEAEMWWNENKAIWNDIQDMWEMVKEHHPTLKFKGNVSGKTLWMRLFELGDKTAEQKKSTGSYDRKALKKEAHDIIHEFFVEHGR